MTTYECAVCGTTVAGQDSDAIRTCLCGGPMTPHQGRSGPDTPHQATSQDTQSDDYNPATDPEMRWPNAQRVIKQQPPHDTAAIQYQAHRPRHQQWTITCECGDYMHGDTMLFATQRWTLHRTKLKNLPQIGDGNGNNPTRPGW